MLPAPLPTKLPRACGFEDEVADMREAQLLTGMRNAKNRNR